MASKSNVNIIKQVQEVFPNYPAYWDAKGENMPNDDELVEGAADEASSSVLDRFIRHLMDVC